MALEKEIIIKVDTEEAEKESQELLKTFGKLDDKAEDIGETSKKGIGEVGTAAKKSKTGVNSLTGAFKGMGIALKALGIGLIISAVIGLGAAFAKNQKIIDIFNTVMEAIGIVLARVSDAFITVFEAVKSNTESFDALGKVVKGILTLAITPLKLAFFGIKLAIQQAMLAWEKSFFGGKDEEKIQQLNADILETKEALVEVGEKAIEAGKGIVNNFREAAGEILDIGKMVGEELGKISIKSAIEQAKINVQLKNSALLAAAAQQGLIEKYDILAERLRQVRDDDRESITARIKANDALLEVLDKQEKAMLRNADLIIATAQAEVNKNNTIENQVALIEALNEKQAVTAQIEGFRSEQLVNRNALLKEQLDLQQAITESDLERQLNQEKFDAQFIENEQEKLNKLIEINETEKELREQQLLDKIDSFAEETQAKIDAEIELKDFLQENANEKAQIEFDLNAQIVKDFEESKKKQAELDRLEAEGKEQIAQNIFGIVSVFAKKGSKVAKGVAVSSALRNTFQGITSALAQSTVIPDPVGTILKFTNAAVIGAMGFANVKNILKTDDSGGGASAGGGGVTAPSVPSFNLVQGTGTNQIAETIADQDRNPSKAFVVSSDVSTSQELDRKIVQGASL